MIIKANNIVKEYSSGVLALKNVSIEVKAGSIFALLGPNGSGKTTFVKSILNLTRIDSGNIQINNKSWQDPSSRLNVGFLPENFTFFPYYTVAQTSAFYARMHGITDSYKLKTGIEEVLGKMGILDLSHKRINTLSKGQLQRLGISNLLWPNHSLVILDEPFTGMDPIGVRDLKNILKELRDKGATVFLNSHILSEVEQVSDEMAILNKGECLASGNLDELRGQSGLEDFFINTIQGR